MEDIVIIGAGGFGREVAWLIDDINKESPQWNMLGFFDDDESIQGKQIGHYRVIGKIKDLLLKEMSVVIAVADPFIRQVIYKQLEKSNNHFPSLIHPSVMKSKLVKLGKGVIISAGSILTVNISIKDFVIIDRSCNVGHDTIIDGFSTLLPSTTISGNVHLEEKVMMGTGSIIIQNLTVGKDSVVGAGSLVTKDIPDKCTAIGVPAKPIKFHENT